jgi:FMN phosphatase YigB (HAD superfamily)
MGIITNTTNPGFMKDFERKSMGLDGYFEFAIYSSEVPYRKPHASIFLMAVNHMGLDVKDILFVGDDLRADIEGAQGVGMPSAWLNRNRRARSGDVRANHEIHALTDMLKLKSA